MLACNMEIICNVILTCLFPIDPTLLFSEIKPKLVQSVNKQETEVLQNIKTQNTYN